MIKKWKKNKSFLEKYQKKFEKFQKFKKWV